MDKQSLIASIAQSPEDTLLLAKIYDKLSAGERRNIPAATAFLTGREQIMARQLTERAGIPNVHAFGGVKGAERQVLCYVPDYYQPEEFLCSEDGPIGAIRAKISAYDHLEHRDFLGGILAQGIRREVLGDIFVGEERCDFLVLRDMAPYLLGQLSSIGRAKVTLTEIPLSDIQVPEQKVKVIRDTVASLRLDSVLAAGFSIGRSAAAELIRSGKVEVNWMPCEKPDAPVQEGDVLTARGLGKCRVETVGGQSRKGRTGITMKRFL